MAQTESHTEGDEALGYKTTLKLESPGQSQALEFFTQREDGVLRLVGSTADPSALGDVARGAEMGRATAPGLASSTAIKAVTRRPHVFTCSIRGR